ncbi:MAG TPA: hypothetical protein VLW85_19995 [Myxococcales bacterium]|nr:hypothetical protein [Myxococcales bacterium]
MKNPMARWGAAVVLALALASFGASAKPGGGHGGGGARDIPEFDANVVSLALAAGGGALIALYGRRRKDR